MKTSLIVLLFTIGLSNCQVTQLEILKSWNYAREHPEYFLALVKAQSTKRGPKGDEACYTECISSLETQKAIKVRNLTEDVGLDLAAFSHSTDMLTKIGHLSHEGSTPETKTADLRLSLHGYFHGAYSYSEMIAYTKMNSLTSADSLIKMFICDCGLKTRPHQKIIFNSEMTHFGAGVSNKDKQTYYTLYNTKGYTRKEVNNIKLDQARIQGDGLYTGAGSSQPIAKTHVASEFAHPGKQIHTEVKIEDIDDSNGPLKDLVNDATAKCPSWINYKDLGKKVIRNWTKRSQKCIRGQAPFSTTDNFDRKQAFAKESHCYQRLSFCSIKGRVWVYDREYKTLDEYNPQCSKQQSKIKGSTDDASVKCPNWVNSDLQIRIIQDWYISSDLSCKQGEEDFGADGHYRIAPFAQSGHCYHRYRYCDKSGQIWQKDTEYVTSFEYEASK